MIASPAWNTVVPSRFFPVGARGACVEGIAMPTYEYRCSKCGNTFERQEHLKEHETAHPQCPKCKSRDLQPVLADFFARTSKKS